MDEVSLSAFNVIAGIVTIVSFLFAIIVFVRDRSLRQFLESGLLGLINTLDRIALMDTESEYNESHMALAAAGARNQAIAMLHAFSHAEERIGSWSFGLKGRSLEEKIRERKELHGSGGGGSCIAANQLICTPSGARKALDLRVGDQVLVLSADDISVISGTITNIQKLTSDHIIDVNGKLSITSRHQVYCRSRQWSCARELSIGDSLLDTTLSWVPIETLSIRRSQVSVLLLSTTSGNLFAGEYLIHNAKGSPQV